MENFNKPSTKRILLSAFYVVAGAMHFIIPNFYMKMMPDYLPYHLELIYLSGLIEISLGFGVLNPKYSKISAWGIILLLLAVFPANVNAYLHPEGLEMPQTLLLVRLPLQLLLIYWAYLFTKD
jgi:uncharacterized membrane protein